ncbi:hypothetical protein LCR77_004391 [Salmonella enterica]|nr:hypothetical protein [Salmonella enterica]
MSTTRGQLVAEMQQRIKEYAPEAIKIMRDVALNPAVPLKLRRKARKDLLERGLWDDKDGEI